MTESRSIEVYRGVRDAQQKLDYFLLGLTSALFAYVGGQYKPLPIGFSQNTVELWSLFLFFVSFIAGFKTLDLKIAIMQLNFRQLDMDEKRGHLNQALTAHGSVFDLRTGKQMEKKRAESTLQFIDETEPKVVSKLNQFNLYCNILFYIRNWGLIMGFMSLGFSKILGVYTVSNL